MGHKVNFAPGKIPSGDKSSRKCINSEPAQETDKRRARFGWPRGSDIAAVTKPSAKPVEICWSTPNSGTDLSH